MPEKRYIILHHSATPDGKILRDFDAIQKYHIEVHGWRDIGYHWVIEYVNNKLTVTPGRPEWDVGAHCLGKNHDSIGICVVGNFQEEVPSEELYQYVAEVCRQVMSRHPIQEIAGHRDYGNTKCPGDNFNVTRVKELIKGEKYNRTTCMIDIKGQKFPGYLQGGKSYFAEQVGVTDIVKAITPLVEWQEKNKVVKII